jgi:hypothetical protein
VKGLVVFLGPSLPAAQARKLAPSCTVLPPARQGDVWKALAGRPRVIALIDGVFESTPPVWHHELLCALAAGVRVLGAASMGALRAVELHRFGMEGHGAIYQGFRDGTLRGDDEVALLHAAQEHGFRPLTVPLVNVRHSAACAARDGRLTKAQARRLVTVAERTHYQARSWPGLLREAELPLDLPLVDLKSEDARLCLRAAVRALREKARPPTVDARAAQGSSLVRLRRLRGDPVSEAVVAKLRARPDALAQGEAGLRRILLSAWARACGLEVDDAELRLERRRWLAQRARGARAQEAFLVQSGLDEASVRVLLQDVLLERRVLQNAQRWVSDGPSWDEALAAQARLTGDWARLAEGPSESTRARAGSAPPSAREAGARARRPRARRGS